MRKSAEDQLVHSPMKLFNQLPSEELLHELQVDAVEKLIFSTFRARIFRYKRFVFTSNSGGDFYCGERKKLLRSRREIEGVSEDVFPFSIVHIRDALTSQCCEPSNRASTAHPLFFVL